MGYRFKDNEAVPDAVRRVAYEQIDRALDRINPKTNNKDRAIHDCRVCFKKIRALLRLVRSEMGEDLFRYENGFYRDAGRQLSCVRDSAAVLNTLEALREHFYKEMANTDIKPLRKQLGLSRVEKQGERKRVMREVAESISQAKERIASWPITNDSFAALGPGLRRVYKQGRMTFMAIRDDASTERLHEWRKQVKHLWYEVSLLNPIWPKMLDILARELNKLADYLSEDHDLSMLRDRAVAQTASGNSSEFQELISFIDYRRAQLLEKARALGERIYAEEPTAFALRVESYWNVWYSGEHPKSVESETAISHQATASA
jgi:CHAD domain-containing protein